VYALRGNARYHLTDPVLMRADYRRAFELDPRLAARTIVRALTRLADEDLNTQLASCEDHLLLAPEDPFSHARRGLLLVLLGRDAEARKDFEAFAAQEPEGANYLPELIAAAEWYRKRATGTKPKSGIAAPPTQAPASPPDISSDLVGQEDEHILGFGLMVG